jgi:translation initiation factor IF-1
VVACEEGAEPLAGVVQRVLERTLFEVRLERGGVILAHLAPQVRMLRGRILVGDSVLVELSKLDGARGRIVATKGSACR